MNASQIFSEDMTLEEKLAAIDQAMQNMQTDANARAAANGQIAAPIDPADATMCLGCQ